MNWQKILYSIAIPKERQSRIRDRMLHKFYGGRIELNDRIWITNDNHVIPLCLMTTSHLMNAYRRQIMFAREHNPSSPHDREKRGRFQYHVEWAIELRNEASSRGYKLVVPQDLIDLYNAIESVRMCFAGEDYGDGGYHIHDISEI